MSLEHSKLRRPSGIDGGGGECGGIFHASRVTCDSGMDQVKGKANVILTGNAPGVSTFLKSYNPLDISRQMLMTPKSNRFGKIPLIPSTTVLASDILRVSSMSSTSKHETLHFGSERNSRNWGSTRIFLKSSTIFVVLKWIDKCPNLRQ